MAYTTHDLGRLFVHVLPKITARFPVRVDHTWEVDPPYRFSRSVVVRLWPFPVGFVIGWWRDSRVESLSEEMEETVAAATEEADFAMYQAVNGTVDREMWAVVRREISTMGLEPDEEMALMQEAGVFGEPG